MTAWDRINPLQLELAEKEAKIRRLTEELFNEKADNVLTNAALTQARESRDLARRVAARLEEENHALAGGVCALCSQVLVPVPMLGEAR